MNKQRFKKLIDEQADALRQLTASKGEEYARSDDDQLANFKRQAAEFGLQPEQVLAIYLNKHLDSIKTYIKHKTPTSVYALAEPIEGRIDDAILYLLLLKAMVVEQKEKDLNPC